MYEEAKYLTYKVAGRYFNSLLGKSRINIVKLI